MLDAVFISDLHLHPDEPSITARFHSFLEWASRSTTTLYILGDFFHVWPGDDGINSWNLAIAQKLNELTRLGIRIYFLHGNRDFLLGKKFAKIAGMTLLPDLSLIKLGEEIVLLTHGDQFCSMDKGHQRFRALTRNVLFIKLFLCLPFKYRNLVVQRIRDRSQQNRTKEPSTLVVVKQTLWQTMKKFHVSTIIHGHTHQPGLTEHHVGGQLLKQYVLSDWDDIPFLLCYDKSKGIYFAQYMI